MSPDLVLTEEFERALELLEQGHNLFLTGKAGTGKSTLIRHFLTHTQRNCLVAAPTGIAALNVGGYTIHRLFGFTPSTTVDDVEGGAWRPTRNTSLLRSVETLIIDEASMVRADLFDSMAAVLQRFGPRPEEPFGGVQIVLVGDLYQLPPVVTEDERDYFTTAYPTPYFFSARQYAPEHFPMVQLSRVFRQAGDVTLTDILNGIRAGTIDDDARAFLNQRTQPDFEPPLDEMWLTLTGTNRIATARNRQQLERLATPLITHRATTSGDLDRFDPPTDDNLVFKVGAQVMMLTNDPNDRFVNGTIGRIIDWDRGDRMATITSTGGTTFRVGAHTWDVTRPVISGGSLSHELIGTYTQLPFRLAWAITIHKSQGQTLERLHVDLTGGTFAYGQLYVALSRATSLQGLVLKRDVLPRDLKTDHRIRRFLATGRPAREQRRFAFIAMILVGDEGRLWRPRPLEIAVLTDDNQEISTLVDPERDLGHARQDFDVTASEAALAPSLVEAWAALAPVLAGRTPVGVDIDRELGYIDFEFKRLGRVVPMPSGIDLDPAGFTVAQRRALTAPTAVERARAIRDAASEAALQDPYADEFDEPDGLGYLFGRRDDEPRLRVGGLAPPDGDSLTSLADMVRERLRGKSLAQPEIRVVRQLEQASGVDIFTGSAADPVDASTVLVPETRVCFTGTVMDATGRVWERAEMERLATRKGLRPVSNVTKTRCDVLVIAEEGTQSNKARNAARWDKPIITAEAFLAWADA